MLTLYRTTLAMCCLASLLPLGALAADAETPEAAAEAAAPATRPPLLERSQEDAQALERRLPKAEQQTLQAGAEPFLALWKPANDSDPQGAVIIVPGAGENADWPDAVGPLRRKFPDFGWHSLSVSLPDLLADAPQARVEATPAAAPEPAAGESAPVKDTPADANANVAQATAADAEVAQGTDAEQASEQNDQADAERIFARLDAAVAYAQQHNARSIVLIGLTPTLKVPTADLYFATRTVDRHAAMQRLQASKRQKDSHYKQLSLIAMPANKAGEQEQLFRRVRGWMSPQQ
ncbi:DUF3530 family protein [Pseudomonas sp.]|uniref:DUF3530 family protein n=1 Tax=Pseudomonas sp. TaxID=306 RepID=UPI0028A655E1|nr:DUF3530 family protein [Pseudomonas sp.]